MCVRACVCLCVSDAWPHFKRTSSVPPDVGHEELLPVEISPSPLESLSPSLYFSLSVRGRLAVATEQGIKRRWRDRERDGDETNRKSEKHWSNQEIKIV